MNKEKFKREFKITPYHLHKLTGIPKPNIYRLVEGIIDIENMTYRNLKKIALALNMSVEEVVKKFKEE